MSSQLAAASLMTSGKKHKCAFSRCPMRNPSQKTKCFVEDCNSMVHPSCYYVLCINKHILNKFVEEHRTSVVCGKSYCNDAQQMVSKSVLLINLQTLAWNRDGKNDPSLTMACEFIIISFLAASCNVAKCRNGDGVKSKEHCHVIICNLIKSAWIAQARTTKEITGEMFSTEERLNSTHG